MKKKILLMALVMLLVLPLNVFAKKDEKKYKTLGLKEVLKAEGIEEEFKSYKETDDQAIIYLFRGEGCGYCRAFLSFLNSITDEYGKKFKLVSYEVWYDDDNRTLMQEVGELMNNVPQGVPYIVIGDQVFAGYAESYDDSIKSKIDEVYKTKKSKRFDVMKELKNKKNESSSSSSVSSKKVIIWNGVFTLVGTLATIGFVNYKINALSSKVEVKSSSKSKSKK